MLQTAWKNLFWIKSYVLLKMLNIVKKRPNPKLEHFFARKKWPNPKIRWKCTFLRAPLSVYAQNLYVRSWRHLQMIYTRKNCEHQPTSKNRQSRETPWNCVLLNRDFAFWRREVIYNDKLWFIWLQIQILRAILH